MADKGQKAVDRYVAAACALARLKGLDPADTPDLEYNLKEARKELKAALYDTNGGSLSRARRILAAKGVTG